MRGCVLALTNEYREALVSALVDGMRVVAEPHTVLERCEFLVAQTEDVIARFIATATAEARAAALNEAADSLLAAVHEKAHAEVCANQYRSDRTAAHVALDEAVTWLRNLANTQTLPPPKPE